MSTHVRLVDPTVPTHRAVASTAPRRASLDGAVVGLLANGKTHGDRIVELVAAELRQRWTTITEPVITKPHPSAPPTDEQVTALRAHADVVVVAIGDCGSCSSCSVVDGIKLEQVGIPAAVIVTEPFLPTVRAIAELNGAPNFPVATMTHPVTSLSHDQLAERIPAVAAQVAAILTGGQAPGPGPAAGATVAAGVDAGSVAAALEPLLTGLRADGADLTVHRIEGSRLMLRLSVRDESCRECMLPLPQLENIVAAAVTQHTGVEITVEVLDAQV